MVGNGETDNHADGKGAMEAVYWGNASAPGWSKGTGSGPVPIATKTQNKPFRVSACAGLTLFTPPVNPGPLYRCGRSTFKEQSVGHASLRRKVA